MTLVPELFVRRLNKPKGLPINVRDVSVTGDGQTDDYAALNEAVRSAGATGTLYFPAGTYVVGTNLTIPACCIFAFGAKLKPSSGVTVTLSGPVEMAPGESVIAAGTAGTVSITGSLESSGGVLDVRAFGAKGDGVTDDTAAIQATYDALPMQGGVVMFPEGTYMVNPDVSVFPPSNSTTIIQSGAIVRAIPTPNGVYEIFYVNNVSDVVITGGGVIEGDKYTHDMSGSLNSATLTTALTGGETTLAVDDVSAWAATPRNLVVVADDGTYAFSVFAINSGTQLGLQTAIPAGFTASIGNPVYHANAQGGMCIRIENSERVTVRGLTTRYAWGDGIYVTKYDRATDTGTKYVLLEDCVSDDNRRQGLSIVGGRYVTVRGGIYSNTQGAQPQHGIDIEPSSTFSCDDILIDGPVCTGNERDGVRVLAGTSPDSNPETGTSLDGLTIARCRVANVRASENREYGINIVRTSGVKVDGVVCFDNGKSGVRVTGDSATNPITVTGATLNSISAYGNAAAGIELTNTTATPVLSTFISDARCEDNGTHGILVTAADHTLILGAQCVGNTQRGVFLTGVGYAEVSGVLATGNLGGVLLSGCTGVSVSDVQAVDNRRSGVVMNTVCVRCAVQGGVVTGNGSDTDNTYDNITISADSSECRIAGVVVHRGVGANQARRGIDLLGASCAISGNTLTEAGKTAVLVNGGSNNRITDNIGYVTEANGTATITSGNTFIAVTHGLSRTPTADDISVTPTNNLGSAAKFWISNIGATTFRINTDVDPGAGTATFAWTASIQ